MERCLWRLEDPGIQERADTILLDISVRNSPVLGLNVIKTESACGRKFSIFLLEFELVDISQGI